MFTKKDDILLKKDDILLKKDDILLKKDDILLKKRLHKDNETYFQKKIPPPAIITKTVFLRNLVY
jgi:hypothetical protein